MRHGTRHRKVAYRETEDGHHVAIIESLRGYMAIGEYPLFVCEETAEAKLQQIQDDAFLRASHRALENLAGVLYVHGSAMHVVDQHLWDTIARCKVTHLRVSIFGDPDARLDYRELQAEGPPDEAADAAA
jgi:hypothetical protein